MIIFDWFSKKSHLQNYSYSFSIASGINAFICSYSLQVLYAVEYISTRLHNDFGELLQVLKV